MCQTIYISEIVQDELVHERFCVNAGHPEHSEIYAEGEWRAKI